MSQRTASIGKHAFDRTPIPLGHFNGIGEGGELDGTSDTETVWDQTRGVQVEPMAGNALEGLVDQGVSQRDREALKDGAAWRGRKAAEELPERGDNTERGRWSAGVSTHGTRAALATRIVLDEVKKGEERGR